MTEDALLAVVTDALTWHGWLWTHPRRSDKALTMGHPGVPDVIAVRGSRLLFLELKRQGGRLTDRQRIWIDALSAVSRSAPPSAPGEPPALTVAVVRPLDMDRFLRLVA